MNIKLKIWRQPNAKTKGIFVDYTLENVSPGMSFLEMLDALNTKLITQGQEPVAFEHDCREGICGSCSLYINGRPHGPGYKSTTCELHMRSFKDGQTIVVEPWRAKAFPVIKDLIVERNAFDKIIMAGGFVSIDAGSAQDANAILVKKANADEAFDSASCIGCAACAADCKNESPLFLVPANTSHLALLPQGRIEANQRNIPRREDSKPGEMQLGGDEERHAVNQ